MRVIGIAALGTEPPKNLVEKASVFVRKLSKTCGKTVIAVGGYWGLMKHVVDLALSEGIKVLIFPPVEKEDYYFPEEAIVVRTGLGYRLRSVALVKTSNILVALGGEAGTIQEIVTAYTEGKPILVLDETGLSTDKLKTLAPYIDARKTAKVEYIRDPETLALRACEFLR
ncbi:MAG: LOG family protein [Thermoprotei archaeon]|nr:MAG: LOG family protein [Thermoprotei archaeon]